MGISIAAESLDFTARVGDVVGCRALISGYGGKKWKLIEADWYGLSIPPAESHSNGYDNKIWRHAGAARITKITDLRVFFQLVG